MDGLYGIQEPLRAVPIAGYTVFSRSIPGIPMVSILAFLLTSLALADIPAEARWLATDRLAIGLHQDGSLVNPAIELGLRWDPDGPQGAVPLGGDWLTPGWPYEVWALTCWQEGLALEWVNGGPWLSSALTLDWDEPQDNSTLTWMEGWVQTESFLLTERVELPWGADLAWLTFEIQALQDLDDLWFSRVMDPDPDAFMDGSTETLGDGGGGWALAEAASGRSLALAVQGGWGGVCSWCETPDEVLAGTGEGAWADNQIGVAVQVGGLPAGASARVVFAVALAMDAEQALLAAQAAVETDDHDGDGWEADEDCDPHDRAVHPDADEIWDGLDNDCDGLVDEGTVGLDDDGDGWSEAQGDCDDADDAVFPGAPPVEGVADADCDGQDDAGWPPGTPDDVVIQTEHSAGGICGTTSRVHLSLWLLALATLAYRRQR